MLTFNISSMTLFLFKRIPIRLNTVIKQKKITNIVLSITPIDLDITIKNKVTRIDFHSSCYSTTLYWNNIIVTMCACSGLA